MATQVDYQTAIALLRGLIADARALIAQSEATKAQIAQSASAAQTAIQDARTVAVGVSTIKDAIASYLAQIAIPYEFSGTRLRLRLPDGSWGAYVDLAGPQGEPGASTVDGLEDAGLFGRQVLRTTSAQIARILLSIDRVANASPDDLVAEGAIAQALLAKLDTSRIGVPGGVAGLGPDGKIPITQAPASDRFVDVWNATTNTPVISAGQVLPSGAYYTVTTAGSTNIGGLTTWQVGDRIQSNGMAWVRIPGTSVTASTVPATPASGASYTSVQGGLDDAQGKIALLATRDSPALTGTPAAPTAAFGTATGQIASTAFVQAGLDDLRLGDSAIAGLAINSFRVLARIGGQVVQASASTATHFGKVVGISTTTATQGASVRFVSGNTLSNPAWSWSEGPVFLGVNGILTQTPPDATGGASFQQQVGVMITPTKIAVTLQPPLQFA